MFSIVIPTWNNLAYLKLCVDSIRRHSAFAHQIIVHVNDGSDGSLQWVREQGLDHTHTPNNAGICTTVNQAASLARLDYVMYMNDDMYCCPGWDQSLSQTIARLDPQAGFMLSCTLIEPRESGNPCVSVGDYGRDIQTFQEEALLKHHTQHHKPHWYGSTWPPNVVPRAWWFGVGGLSSELSPGMGSDNDFSMKLWAAGCRVFLGLGDAMVYHFQSKSTGKIVKNPGHLQFLHKWGITPSTFDRFYMHSGEPASGLTLPPLASDDASFRWHHWRSAAKRRLMKHPFKPLVR
jgi:glycosyltransferase involved in cell wall biosynthesis